MKVFFAGLLLMLCGQFAFAELTPEAIRIIVREEVKQVVRAEQEVLEKRLREYVDLKFEILDTKFTTKLNELDTKFTTKFEDTSKQQTLILILVTALIVLIVLAIGIPQIIIALKQQNQDALVEQVKTLSEKVIRLEQAQLVDSD